MAVIFVRSITFLSNSGTSSVDDVHDKFLNEFVNSQLVKALDLHNQEDRVEMFNERYLNDYINMVYPSNTVTEMKV